MSTIGGPSTQGNDERFVSVMWSSPVESAPAEGCGHFRREREQLKGLKFAAALALVFGLIIATATPASAQLQQPYGANDFGGFRNILPPGQSHNATINEVVQNTTSGAVPRAVGQPAEPLRRSRLRRSRALRTPRSTSTSRTGRSAIPPGAERAPLQPEGGHHDRPRPDLRRPPRLRRLPRERDVRRRLRRRPRPPLLHGCAPQRGPRRRSRSSRAERTRRRTSTCGTTPPTPRATCSASSTSPTRPTAPTAPSSSSDVQEYVAGVNQFISEAQANPSLLPGEYTLLGKSAATLEGDRRDRHLCAGRRHLRQGRRRRGLERRDLQCRPRALRRIKGVKVWEDLRRANDPEAPTTVVRREFPYQQRKARAVEQEGGRDPGCRLADRRAAPTTRPPPARSPATGPAAARGCWTAAGPGRLLQRPPRLGRRVRPRATRSRSSGRRSATTRPRS